METLKQNKSKSEENNVQKYSLGPFDLTWKGRLVSKNEVSPTNLKWNETKQNDARKTFVGQAGGET